MIDYNIRDANATSTNFNSPENVVNRNLNESPSYINLSEDSDFCGFVYNPDDPDTYFEIWMGCLLTAVGILGIIGNIVSMIILSRPQMLQTASVYMTFIVTLERYIAVCHPLKARAMCTYGRAKLYFIGCLIFSTLYNIPRFWEVINRAHEIHQYPGLKEKIFTNEDVIYCIEPSEIRIDQTYINIYIHWCYLIRLSRSEQREISLATMLICVVIVFFLFNFLAFYLNILEAFYRQIRTNLTKISNLLVTINSSANFIIYVIFGEKFKRICLQLFCKRKYNRDAPDLIHYESSISNGGGDGGTNRMSRKFSRHGTTRSTI
uniref:G-protein coupled receptors family 1 profile domain-containing protein n=1 Tax=Megaselia scalaris TaxID=36166 RepID=T1GZ53_MEGSC